MNNTSLVKGRGTALGGGGIQKVNPLATYGGPLPFDKGRFLNWYFWLLEMLEKLCNSIIEGDYFVKKHIKSIPLYRKNHPEHLVVFFVFDESSAYVQVDDKNLIERGIKAGEAFDCETYCHFLDKKMVDVFKGTDIDYLIWYTPFKHYESTCPFELSKVCVYDVKRYTYEDVIDYPEKLIMSTEE